MDRHGILTLIREDRIVATLHEAIALARGGVQESARNERP
jgi:hypothetical protein